MEREFDLKWAFIKVLRRWRSTAVFALTIAALLCGYTAYSQFSAVNDISVKAAESLEKDYQADLLEYELEMERLQLLADFYDGRIDWRQRYIDNSLYMQLDQYALYTHVIVFVIDTGYQIMPGATYQTPDKLADILNAYLQLIDYDGIYREAAGILETDIERVMDLVTVSVVGNNLLQIWAYGTDAGMARTMAETAGSYVVLKSTGIKEIIGEHTITQINSSGELTENMRLGELQRDVRQSRIDLIALKNNTMAEIDALEEPEFVETDSVRASVVSSALRRVVFAGAAGLAVGVMLAAVWAIITFAFDPLINDGDNLNQMLGISVLGRISVKGSGGRNAADRLIDRIEGARVRNIPADEGVKLLYQRIAALREDSREPFRVLCTSSGDFPQLGDICAKLSALCHAEGDKIRLVTGASILVSAETIKAVSECGAAIIFEKPGVSMLVEVSEEIRAMKEIGTRVGGIVLLS